MTAAEVWINTGRIGLDVAFVIGSITAVTVMAVTTIRRLVRPVCALCGADPAQPYRRTETATGFIETPGWLGPDDYVCEGCADTAAGWDYISMKSRQEGA